MKNRDYLINVNSDNVSIKFDSTSREEAVPRIYVIKSYSYLDLIGFTLKIISNLLKKWIITKHIFKLKS